MLRRKAAKEAEFKRAAEERGRAALHRVRMERAAAQLTAQLEAELQARRAAASDASQPLPTAPSPLSRSSHDPSRHAVVWRTVLLPLAESSLLCSAASAALILVCPATHRRAFVPSTACAWLGVKLRRYVAVQLVMWQSDVAGAWMQSKQLSSKILHGASGSPGHMAQPRSCSMHLTGRCRALPGLSRHLFLLYARAPHRCTQLSLRRSTSNRMLWTRRQRQWQARRTR